MTHRIRIRVPPHPSAPRRAVHSPEAPIGSHAFGVTAPSATSLYRQRVPATVRAPVGHPGALHDLRMPRSNNDEHPLHYAADGDRPEATLTHDAPLGAHRGLLLARDLNRSMRSRKLPLHGLADLARVAHSTVARVLNGDVLPDIGTSDTTGGGTRPSALARPRSDSRFGISQARGGSDSTGSAAKGRRQSSRHLQSPRLHVGGGTDRTSLRSALTETNTNQPYTENRRSHSSQRPTPVLHPSAPPRSATLFTSAVRSRKMSARETVASTSAPPLTSGLVRLG